MNALLLLAVALGYGLLLFAIAWRAERSPPHDRHWRRYSYPLALAVYCTSWTFFGAVGSAYASGWLYLPIYLGPILVYLVGAGWLTRLVTSVRREGAASLSDFISLRFGRSPLVAACVTLLMLVGMVPYLALQLRSIGSSFVALGGAPAGAAGVTIVIAAILALFAIAFGTRRFDRAGRSDGLLMAVSVESLVKLAAFCIVGLFALLLFLDASPLQQQQGADALARTFAPSAIGADFLVITLLSAAAAICLPRQFYIGVIEAPSNQAPQQARWPIIGYLLLTAAIVIPITLAAHSVGGGAVADLIVIALPLNEGAQIIALIAFIGGFSAATAMVIVEAVALSTMVSNDLVGPVILRTRRWRATGDVGALMLAIRRAIIVALLAVAVLFALAIPSGAQLASIGLIAFAAAVQVAPALVLAVARGNRRPDGAVAGITAGGIVWAYTLFAPAVAPGWAASLAGSLADPHALLGITGMSAIVHGTLWSVGVNLLCHAIAVARRLRPQLSFIDASDRVASLAGDVRTLTDLVSRFVGAERARIAFADDRGDAPVTRAIAVRAERLLGEVVGAANARALIASALSGARMSVAEVTRLLDHGSTSLQFSRELLAATLENIDPAVSVVDRELNLIAWNSRYLELFAYPPGMVRAGAPVADLIRHNALRGECGPGEVEAHVERRLAHMRRGLRHSFERVRPDGRVLKTVGGPMPGGGYVMCFTDVTAEVEAREALEAERQSLERRVGERTRQLSLANDALARATADKTRFLAAASHDLLQPLHAARLFGAALRPHVAASQQPMLDGIAAAIRSADEVLKTLLDISKLDSGGIEPRLEPVALDPLLADLVASFAPLADERGLRLRRVPTESIVMTDRVLLRSILQNFLSNAVRYTRRGGIVIGVRRGSGDAVRIAVYDSGPGIAAADRERLFREFERGSSVGEQSGVGLGLAIVERTARLLDAPVALRSEPGRGSCFSVRLPRAADALPASASTLAVDPGAGTKMVRGTLLVVDDDAAIRAAMHEWGAAVGVAVWAAADAEAALGAPGPFASALVDFNLGEGIDGIALAACLADRWPGLRVAIVSAEQRAEPRARAAAAGHGWLHKPVDPVALMAWLSDDAVQTGAESPNARAASAA